MNELTHSYTSPRTGRTYEAVLDHRGFSRWDIFRIDGETRTWVQFALTEGEIASTIKFLEVPGPHLGSRFD